jgi:hypothetical protein
MHGKREFARRATPLLRFWSRSGALESRSH